MQIIINNSALKQTNISIIPLHNASKRFVRDINSYYSYFRTLAKMVRWNHELIIIMSKVEYITLFSIIIRYSEQHFSLFKSNSLKLNMIFSPKLFVLLQKNLFKLYSWLLLFYQFLIYQTTNKKIKINNNINKLLNLIVI